MSQLLTANFYSVLFYNSEIWHIPSLHIQLKQNLLAASAIALRVLENKHDLSISFAKLHSINKKATPIELINYKHALQLYKVFNDKEQKDDWVDINFSMNFNNRCKNVLLTDMSSLRVGKNILSNRLSIISNKVDLSWLNQSYETYKVNCKRLLMT